MTRPDDLSAQIRPLLDIYLDAAVGLIGCQSRGIQRESCELDVLLVSNETRLPNSVKIGGTYMDLTFVSERRAMKPSTPEDSASMALAMPIRDSSLVLSTSVATAKAIFGESCRKASQARLGLVLKSLGRSEDSLSKGATREADLWLTEAANDFAFSCLYSIETIPSPAHLIEQLKALPKRRRGSFEAFSAGAGLERSSRQRCAKRLEGVSVLHDLISSRKAGSVGSGPWGGAKLEVLTAKTTELNIRLEHGEAFSLLGLETVSSINALAADDNPLRGNQSDRAVAGLFEEGRGLLSERLMVELGFDRGRERLATSIQHLREQASRLAREG